MPVQELRGRITFTEFLDWLAYLKYDEERRSKQDFYLAQIATEVRRSFLAKPNDTKVEEFFIHYVPTEKVNKSKQTWASALDLKLN